jgi:DNA-directed RNA polymerase subunit M/transcription elongation factor TFIIS
MDYREKVARLINNKSDLDELHSKDTEIGIYNWCIEYCDKNKIFKSWKNERFIMLYLEKARSIISNLDKDCYLGNTHLLSKINNKNYIPHEIAFMKPEIVFPDKWKDITEAFYKKLEHAFENRMEAMSSDIKCFRCKERKVVYQEVFSRSADEAGVIHYLCLNCGSRWKV